MITHKYKGKEYQVQTGAKGGQFFIDDAGKKHYLKSTTSVKKKVEKKKVAEETCKRYICYYVERDDNGEMIDDFKEYTDAYSYDEAKDYFENEYRHNPHVQIDLISRE